MGCCDVRGGVIHRRLSLDLRVSRIFLRVPVWCRCRDAVVVVVYVAMMSRLVARAFSSADHLFLVSSNDAQIASI